MRKNSIHAAIILFLIILLVSTVSCKQSSNEPTPGDLTSLRNAPDGGTADSVTITAGKTKSLDFVFTTKKNGPGKLSLVVLNIGKPFQGGFPPELPLPTGLNVSVEPKELMAYPNRTYHFTISINTSAELEPGIYWLRWISTFESGWESSRGIQVIVEPAFNTTVPDTTWFPSKFSEIDVTHVGSGPSFVSFSGPAGLPAGTILLSALYEDGKLLPGWPTNQPIIVENGKWEVNVPVGVKSSPPALRSGPSYLFVVWRKDNPESFAGKPFDLVGPPPPAP